MFFIDIYSPVSTKKFGQELGFSYTIIINKNIFFFFLTANSCVFIMQINLDFKYMNWYMIIIFIHTLFSYLWQYIIK